jgi:hypothetical protein
MSITTHINTLTQKHHQLDVKLHNAYMHHFPNEEIAKIKKEKLEIKDQITKLSGAEKQQEAAA